MTLLSEAEALRKQLAGWAVDPERDFISRFDLLNKKPPRSLSDRLARQARGLLADLGVVPPPVTTYPWLATLKHALPEGECRTLLIWAVGIERAELRRCCEGVAKRLDAASGMIPVLVTDVADFAYFSRLKWLVEYVPDLSGDGPSYRERKQRYLAWRYRDALIVPAAAGCADLADWNRLMELWI